MALHRRGLLLASVSLLSAGCLGAGSGETNTRSPGGGKPPWYRDGSDADVVVQNGLETRVEVSLSVGSFETTVELAPGDHWGSGNVVTGPGERPVEVTATGEDGATWIGTGRWRGEGGNEGFVNVLVADDGVEIEMESRRPKTSCYEETTEPPTDGPCADTATAD